MSRRDDILDFPIADDRTIAFEIAGYTYSSEHVLTFTLTDPADDDAVKATLTTSNAGITVSDNGPPCTGTVNLQRTHTAGLDRHATYDYTLKANKGGTDHETYVWGRFTFAERAPSISA